MTFKTYKNQIIESSSSKPILFDIYESTKPNAPVLLYCHGFKGFKDWGPTPLMYSFFAQNGIHCVALNFSHNGSTPEAPSELSDMEAFGNNTISQELDDLEKLLHWLSTQKKYNTLANYSSITLMGHSRGAGTALIKAFENSLIDKVIMYAGVAHFKPSFIDDAALDYWKKTGVLYVENSRTKQQMPLYYVLAQDIIDNQDRFDLKRVAEELNKPMLLLHGKEDTIVPPEASLQLNKWCNTSKLKLFEGANHTFNVKHPWQENDLPIVYQEMLSEVLQFVCDK